MSLINQFFAKLNGSSIRYCQFKSTQHLDRSFEGKTDFDLFVHPDDVYLFQAFILGEGGKQRLSTFDRSYISMDDYLIYDPDCEQMFHFHIHYSLLFGEKFSKNYYIPLAEWIDDQIVLDENYNIKTFTPELELVLLVQRIFLKTKFNLRAFAKSLIKRRPIPINMYDELDYLLEKFNRLKFCDLLEKRFSTCAEGISNFISQYEESHLSFWSILSGKRTFIKKLREQRRLSHETVFDFKKLRKRSVGSGGRRLISGGKAISIIGADGAGKTSVTEELRRWLSYKLDAKVMYLGRPKRSVIIKVLDRFGAGVRKLINRQAGQFILDFSHVYIARIRWETLCDARYYANEGQYILFDRYPLKEFSTMEEPMDGPRLPESSFWYKTEQGLYAKMADYPDIGIVLSIDIATSIDRKPEHSSDKYRIPIEKKIDAISSLDIFGKKGMLRVDATQSFKEVLAEAKNWIWENV